MSLILDALRRADRARERDVGRRVTQAMPPRAQSRSPARAAFIAAIAVTATAAGIAGWLARPVPGSAPVQPASPRIIEVAPRVRGSSLAQIAVPAREGPDSPALPPAPPLSTLSAAVQASVPPIAVNAHVWSDDPAKRFVMLNGRLYRDGDIVEDGLRLAAVVPDGAELEWRGVRFRVPAQ
jgi:general secretion pathway protein B